MLYGTPVRRTDVECRTCTRESDHLSNTPKCLKELNVLDTKEQRVGSRRETLANGGVKDLVMRFLSTKKRPESSEPTDSMKGRGR